MVDAIGSYINAVRALLPFVYLVSFTALSFSLSFFFFVPSGKC